MFLIGLVIKDKPVLDELRGGVSKWKKFLSDSTELA
jgi:hypothetical protein